MVLFFRIKEALVFAFSEAPLLFFGLAFILGIWLQLAFQSLLLVFLVLFFSIFFLIFLALFFFSLSKRKRLSKNKKKSTNKRLSKNKKLVFIFLFLILAGYLETYFLHPSFLKVAEKTPATAIFKIDSIAETTTYKKAYLLKGTLKTLQLVSENSENSKNIKNDENTENTERIENKTYYNLPCTVYCSQKKRPTADKIYALEGTVRNRSPYYYIFKAQKNLKPIGSCWNFLAEKRFVMQKKLERLLRKKLKHKSSFIFLNSQMTGSMKSNLWRFIFTKTGMQHILAISGFHFMALLFFFSFFLKRLPFARFLPWTLLVLISLYALYIGPSPSVQRAWIASLVILSAQILGKNNFALNTLGLALLFELVIDPINLTALSFQLSFLSVGAILFLYQPLSDFLSRWLQKRTAFDCKGLNLLEKTGAHFINYLRAALTISLSVSLCLIPVLLFYFHSFPLLGLVYNLFFPILISFSFYLLLIALLTLPLASIIPLSTIFFFLADHSAAFSLNLLASYPQCLNFSLRTKSLSFPLVVIWLLGFFLGALLFKYRTKSALNPQPIFNI